MSQSTDRRALDTLLEIGISFTIEGDNGKEQELCLYPLQLGRLAMISKRLLNLDIELPKDQSDIAWDKMWAVCAEKTREVAEIIAISTLRTKEDIDNKLSDRVDLILWSPSMTTEAYTYLLSTIVFQSYYEDFIKAIGSVRTLMVKISQPTMMETIASMGAKVSGGK